MDAERWRRVQQLFESALEQPPDRREEWLDATCASDPGLRDEVLALLAEETDDRLAGIVASAAESALGEPGSGMRGQFVGPYRIEREIGRGGMGTVYLATRADGEFEQRVAIKVVRERLARPDLVERFRVERQILARLEHPNIARLIDGGTTDDGAPYVVMELVDGVPLDRHCEDRGLPVAKRLELFLTVCDAVQYAHRNLIVHRDLKPSNVLVTADGKPKLLDFGVARLLDPSGESGDPATRTAARMLTPDYASPEQIRGEPVSTASDVYSLGVMLYELLTGRRPYSGEATDIASLERRIVEGKAERPSTAVRGKRTARFSSVERLRRRLAGDLDNIVMMALRREPERRYGSVRELTDDIGRHLDGLPVLARTDSWSYRAGKFVRRNRWGLAAAAAIAATLVGWGATMSVQAVSIARERDRVREALAGAEQTAALLEDVFKVSDPREGRGAEVTARELLDEGHDKVRERLVDQPLLLARLLTSLGRVYRNLGLYDRSLELAEESLALRRAGLPRGDAEVSDSLMELALVLQEKGELAPARVLLEEALEIRENSDGRDHPRTAQCLGTLGALLRLQGDLDAAEAMLSRALAILESGDDPDFDQLQVTRNNLAVALEYQGELESSVPLLERVLADTERELGGQHPDVSMVLNNLGTSLYKLGEFERALEAFDRSTAIMESSLGEEHPLLATAYVNLAAVAGRTGRIERKLELEMRAIAIEERTRGPEHPDVGLTLINLGSTLRNLRRLEEARDAHERAFGILDASLGPDHAFTASAMLALCEDLALLWELEGRAELFERSWRTTEARKGADDPATALTRIHLGLLARFEGRDADALTHLQVAAEVLGRVAADQPPHARALMELAILRARQGDHERADILRSRAEAVGTPLPEGAMLYSLARLDAARGRIDRARESLERSLALGEPASRVTRDPDLNVLAN